MQSFFGLVKKDLLWLLNDGNWTKAGWQGQNNLNCLNFLFHLASNHSFSWSDFVLLLQFLKTWLLPVSILRLCLSNDLLAQSLWKCHCHTVLQTGSRFNTNPFGKATIILLTRLNVLAICSSSTPWHPFKSVPTPVKGYIIIYVYFYLLIFLFKLLSLWKKLSYSPKS